MAQRLLEQTNIRNLTVVKHSLFPTFHVSSGLVDVVHYEHTTDLEHAAGSMPRVSYYEDAVLSRSTSVMSCHALLVD